MRESHKGTRLLLPSIMLTIILSTAAHAQQTAPATRPPTDPGDSAAATTRPMDRMSMVPACCVMMPRGSGMGMMAQGTSAGGAMSAANDGGSMPQYSCCPPSAMSTMIKGPMGWIPMVLSGLLLLSGILVLLALTLFFVRRSRVGVPARA